MPNNTAIEDIIADDAQTPAPEPIPASVPILAAETWAERKGFFPQFFSPATTPHMGSGAGSVAVSMRDVVGVRPNHEFWRFAAAKALCSWPTGKEMTEADFDAAIERAAGQQAR